MLNTWKSIAVTAIAVCISLTGSAFAADTVRVSQAGYQLYRLPMYVAQLKGFFKEENLEVEFVSTRSGADSIKMLVGGSVEFEDGPPIDVINLRKQGIEAHTVALLNSRLNNSILVRKDLADSIKTFADLQGRSVGMTGIGSGTWQVLAALANSTDVDLDKINLVSLGTQGIIAAFMAGRIDALSYVDPENYLLLKQGEAVPLIDFNDDETHKKYLGEATIYNQVAVLDSYAEANPTKVQGFVNGIQKALSWLHSADTAEIVQLVKGFEPFKDIEVEDIKGMLERTKAGYPSTAAASQDAYDSTMKFMTVVGVLTDPIPMEQMIDNSYAEKAAQQSSVSQ